jgi:hypothetical protein
VSTAYFNFDRPAHGGYGPGTAKKQFHFAARRQLRHLALALRLPEGSYEISSNKGGNAVSGEVTLHGEAIYVQAGQCGLGLLFRRCKGRKDYGSGLDCPNCWTPLAGLNRPIELARIIKRKLEGDQDPTTTPWGKPDEVVQYAPGITWYSTPSHGGFHLDRERSAKVPAYMRRAGGWYEEDCDWAIVATVFPEVFIPHDKDEAPKRLESARTTLRNWHPDSYERFYGVTLQPGESYKRDNP